MSSNPLHDLIERLGQHIQATWRCLHAATRAEKAQALQAWGTLRTPFWTTYRIPVEAFRGLADPALAWCCAKGFGSAEHVATVENAVHFIVELSKLTVPCAMPSVFANEDEAQTIWEHQGEFLMAALASQDGLRRLAALTGDAWKGDGRLPWDPPFEDATNPRPLGEPPAAAEEKANDAQRKEETGSANMTPKAHTLPLPEIRYECTWTFADFYTDVIRVKDGWQTRRDSALRAIQARYEEADATPRWARTAEALVWDLDRRWCREWCLAIKLIVPLSKAEDLRLWCDLQYVALDLAEHARRRTSWVRSETPPPDELEESSHWSGKRVELEDAAAPVLCLLDDPPAADWAALEHEVALLHGTPCEDGEVLSPEDLARMSARAWVAMRAIGSPVPPEEINVTTIPAARRALDVVTNWLHHREENPVAQWEFAVDGFRYQSAVWHNLNKQSLRLLEAFVNARHMTLTIEEVNQAATGDRETDIDRPYAYVSELNKELCRIWKVQDKPIRSIRGASTYRFTPPFDDLRHFVAPE
jgi:hypothetical protein